MKAYKIVLNYKGRYFSYNPSYPDIVSFCNKKKPTGIESWKILEYFPNKWVSAKRNAKSKDLFVFKKMKSKSQKTSKMEIWLVEVPNLKLHPYHGKWCTNGEHEGPILEGSYITSKVKLLEKL